MTEVTNQVTVGASQVSYLKFSSLESEVVLVRHVENRPKALISEEGSVRMNESSLH